MARSTTLSLRARLAGTMAVLFLGGTLALYLAARVYAQTAADTSYDRLLAGSVLSIAETLSISGREVQVDLPYAALDMLSAAPEDRVFYRIFGPNERTVTGYDDLPAPLRDTVPRTDAPYAPRFFNADYRGELVRFAMLGREIAEPGVSGWVWVQVGQTRRARDALADELVVGALIPIAFMTVLALALVWFGIGRALRPLQIVERDLSRREPDDLHPVAAPVPAEIALLVDAINGFMRRLQGSIETLRAFIAQAAHQMRTPLAALRAQAQVAVNDEDPEELRRSLRAVERNAAKLTRLLNQLLIDATVIHRSDLQHRDAFELIEMIHESIGESVPVASNADVRFEPAVDSAPFVGDQVTLREAMKNLIDNALHYGGTTDENPIEIALAAEGDVWILTVADRGPGIAVEDRERVFQRFERADGTKPGAGLGLAIVRQAVESHGGRVSLADREGGGLLVQIRLPRGHT